eukprot:9029424-Pyramimonas_sp.AAC.1
MEARSMLTYSLACLLRLAARCRSRVWLHVQLPRVLAARHALLPLLVAGASLGHRVGPHVSGVAPQHVLELLGAKLVAQPPEMAGHRVLRWRPDGVGQQGREDRHAVCDQLGWDGVACLLPQPPDLLR